MLMLRTLEYVSSIACTSILRFDSTAVCSNSPSDNLLLDTGPSEQLHHVLLERHIKRNLCLILLMRDRETRPHFNFTSILTALSE